MKFQFGKFHDEVLCDVIPIKYCHLLFERFWIIEREAIFDKKCNKCCVNLRGKEYFFVPFTLLTVKERYLELLRLTRRKGAKLEEKDIIAKKNIRRKIDDSQSARLKIEVNSHPNP